MSKNEDFAARAWEAATRIRRARTGTILAAGAVGVVFAAAIAGQFLRDSAYELAGEPLDAPSGSHIVGTDQLGRDVLTRLIVGASPLVARSGLAAGLAVILALVVGLLASVRSGRADELAMRGVDVLMSIPELLLAMVVLLIWGSGSIIVILVVGLLLMPTSARVFRSATLSLREADFVAAARLRGDRNWWIALWEILPNIRHLILVEFAVRFGFAVLLTSALAFLGLGAEPPEPQWGLMVSEGRNVLDAAPWISLTAAALIGLLVLSVHHLADAWSPARLR